MSEHDEPVWPRHALPREFGVACSGGALVGLPVGVKATF